jgi:hypothetical protein
MAKPETSTRSIATGSPEDVDEPPLEADLKLDVLESTEGVLEVFLFVTIFGVPGGGGMSILLASDLNAACREDSVCLICSGTSRSRIQDSKAPASLLRLFHSFEDSWKACVTSDRRRESYTSKVFCRGRSIYCVRTREKTMASSMAYAADSSRGSIYKQCQFSFLNSSF